ncbi:juvenile hormone esterase-like [Culex pipiens pallens]|uniref:juvenile hormone esterase-like n=1 Tax=Culex pipiens pallens TaxID=42434 RepID=UPI001953BFFD|nr:juvenile hormone esterase-like [Culex pipiens pallens]
MWLLIVCFIFICSKIASVSPLCDVNFPKNISGVGIQSSTFNNFTYCQYLGVPYATAQRFQEPVLHQPSDREDYSQLGSVCPQMNDFNYPTAIIGSEDCLFLNVYTPEVLIGQSFPVLVFIHGGSFTIGSATFDVGGVDLLMENKIIVVTMNYRLDVLGFLRYPKFNITGNYGLKDQHAALKWINRYIEFFGGDPNRVTLMGQSAGASSVGYHLYSDRSMGLFQQAALLSGSLLSLWAYSYRAEFVAEVYLNNLGITSRKQLVDRNFKDLFFLNRTSKFIGGRWMPTAEADDDPDPFLTSTPQELVLRKRPLDIPLLVGVTLTEFELMRIPNVQKLNLDKFNVPNRFNETVWILIDNFTERIIDSLKGDGLINKREDFIRKAVNDIKTNFPVENFLNATISKGHSLPIYAYRFDFDGKFGRYKNDHFKPGIDIRRYGAVHGDDLSYIFTPYNVDDALKNRDEFRNEWFMYQQMSEIVANFVKFGNPSLKDFDWKTYNAETGQKQFARIDGNLEMKSNSLMEPSYYSFCKSLYDCLYLFNCSSME